MKPIKLVTALLAFATALSAHAAPLLNGLALEQQFNKDRYIAAVYSENLTTNSSALLDNDMPRRLEIRIVADRLSARRFRNQWMEGIAINNPGDLLTEQADNMVTFANLFQGRFYKGDHLDVVFAVDTGTTSVALNGLPLGQIEDREFFNTLLRAWVGPVPPSSDFREGLLADGDVESSMLGRYEALEPTAERIAEIEDQLEAREAEASEEPVEEEVAATEPEAEDPEVEKPTLAATEVPKPSLASANETAAAAAGAAEKAAPEPSQPEPAKPARQEAAKRSAPPEMEEEEEEETLTADLILARQLYHSQLLRHTYGHIRYPQRAQERGQEGSVRLNVTIDQRGEVRDVQTVQDSRYATLNRAARKAVEDASPFPTAPSQLIEDEFRFTLPITFQLSN
ncbi:TonB family protein [Microbulbifer halophilus]|uniref:TonB family protein n=1 Tax=Microbulbifer halophilus TaxID=453963 RepID=A0ABW5EA18_9GAMM|nr:TonB family protein [Microbulbifer halophilus]MCW8126432.1 TonB family protein [Microbulbifer halophilus]